MLLPRPTRERKRGPSLELCALRRGHSRRDESTESDRSIHRERESGERAMSKMMEEKQAAAGQDAAAGVSRVRPVETLLRAAPLGLCVAAMVIMLRDRQANEYGVVAYSDLGGFKYLVAANGLCAAYSLGSAFYTAMPGPATLSRSWAVFLLDQVFTYLILAAGAASSELLYLAYNGDKEVTWSEACGVYGSFCRQARTSVAITFASVLCYVLLSLISSHRLFSAYEPPAPRGNKGVEIAAYPR